MKSPQGTENQFLRTYHKSLSILPFLPEVEKGKFKSSISFLNQQQNERLKNTNQNEDLQSPNSNIRPKTFSDHKKSLTNSVQKLRETCENKLNTIANINFELNRLKGLCLTKKQQIFLRAKIIPKHLALPDIDRRHLRILQKSQFRQPNIRSQSEKNILALVDSQKQTKQNQLNRQNQQSQRKRNSSKPSKCDIKAKKRFAREKQKAPYIWKTGEGLKNLIRKEQLKLTGEQIKTFVDQFKQKYQREPIFCHYAKFS